MPAGSDDQRKEQLIATGFLALGVKDVNQRFKVRYVMDNIDEQIDTVTRSVLGLTVSCAVATITNLIRYRPLNTTDSQGSSAAPIPPENRVQRLRIFESSNFATTGLRQRELSNMPMPA